MRVPAYCVGTISFIFYLCMSESNAAEKISRGIIENGNSFEKTKVFGVLEFVPPEMRSVYETDFFEIFDFTKSLEDFDRDRFENMLEICIHSIEKHTKVATGMTSYTRQESFDGHKIDFRELGYEIYVWLVDILTSIRVALARDDQNFLKESIAVVHQEVEGVLSFLETQKNETESL